MGGRKGLIDTAIKTAETGYIQHQPVKVLKDVMVDYDGTVQNSLGDVLQFIYREDGMNGDYIERQCIETFHLSDLKFKHNYWVNVTDPAGRFLSGVLQVSIDDSSLELQARLDKEYTQLLEDCKIIREDTWQHPSLFACQPSMPCTKYCPDLSHQPVQGK